MIDYSRFKGGLRRRWERGKNYCTDILCFDIETTSCWINENGEIIPYIKGKNADYWNSLQALALPYLFMFSVNDTVYYGRELSDFLRILKRISVNRLHCIIWVHNLSFEFQFLSNILHWDNVFARSPHRVMKCTSKEFPNIEFRCTYFLTRLSLDNWSKQTGVVRKLVGQLDYNQIRTPYTPLMEHELEYGENDVLAMYHGIKAYVKKYGTQENIPLTQTGTVRRVVKQMLQYNDKHMARMKEVMPDSAELYKTLQGIFSGGYTHANRLHAGIAVKCQVSHWDFASSYPYVMLAFKYPMEKWQHSTALNWEDVLRQKESWDDVAYLYKLKFTELNSKTFNTFLQASKVALCGEPDALNPRVEVDNGRILYLKEGIVWLTEQDLQTLIETYTWRSVEVLECLYAKKEYLPRDFLEYLLDLYADKTTLKGVEGKEALYLQSKEYINSLYGMMVTALVQADVVVDENLEWSMERLTREYVDKELAELEPFLSYSWGIYVTAYARRNLWECILKYDERVLYADTDSIFMLGIGDFSDYNNGVLKRLEQTCTVNDLDMEKTHPKDRHGKEHMIGVFARENDCMEFKTLGAKRYCYRDAQTGKLNLTVSGINKGAVECLHDDINNFTDGFNFDKDAPSVTKKLLIYINDMPQVTFPDGYVLRNRFGIAMRNNGYELELKDEYSMLIDYCDGKVLTSDAWETAKRGRFL